MKLLGKLIPKKKAVESSASSTPADTVACAPTSSALDPSVETTASVKNKKKSKKPKARSANSCVTDKKETTPPSKEKYGGEEDDGGNDNSPKKTTRSKEKKATGKKKRKGGMSLDDETSFQKNNTMEKADRNASTMKEVANRSRPGGSSFDKEEEEEEDWDTDSGEIEGTETHTANCISPTNRVDDNENGIVDGDKDESDDCVTDDDDNDDDKDRLTQTQQDMQKSNSAVTPVTVSIVDAGAYLTGEEHIHKEFSPSKESIETDDEGEMPAAAAANKTASLEERSFFSPTTVQKQAAMSTPSSPLPFCPNSSLRPPTPQLAKPHILRTGTIPFFGREKEMKALSEIVGRISGSTAQEGVGGLENKPEVVLVSGSALGVGSSTFVNEAFYGPSIYNQSRYAFGRCITCRGVCEANAGLSSPPLQVFSDLLNDLVVKLLLPGREGGKHIWKERMLEALGEEGPLLATLVPKIGMLMDLPGFANLSQETRPSKAAGLNESPEKKKIAPPSSQLSSLPNYRALYVTQWDWNTPQRFQRLCLAVRDLIQAVAEFVPLVMIIDNLQSLDEDAWAMLYTIIKSPTLKNFLFVGIHNENTQGKEPQKLSPENPDAPIWQFEKALFMPVQRRIERLVKSKQGASGDDIVKVREEDDTEIPNMPRLSKIHLLPFSKTETRNIVESIFQDGHASERKPATSDPGLRLSKALYSWSGGNILCLIQIIRWLNEEGLLTYKQTEETWSWDENAVENQMKKLQSTDATTVHATIDLVVTARISQLPKQIKFVVVAISALQQSHFSTQHLYRVLKAAHAPDTKNAARDKTNIKEFPISSPEELEVILHRACVLGMMKRSSRDHHFAFGHDTIRERAYSEMPKRAKGFSENSDNPAARKDWQIHCRLGTEFSALAVLPESSVEERDRCKFLAADQLVISQKIMWDDRNNIAKLLLETAESCVARSAFASAIVFLETAISLLSANEQFTSENHGTCSRIYLWLAKLRLACGNIDAAKDACDRLKDQAKSLKEQVPMVQIRIQILLMEGCRQEALDEAIGFLEKMGERFPKTGITDATVRELDQLRNAVRKTKNSVLIRPKRITDKKCLDVLVLLANVLEISLLSRKRSIQDLAMIRMMNLSLKFGFSRQYPMAFAYFSLALIQRGIQVSDAEMVKEGHRMGQVCEKMARLGDFYGGQSVALFHWHVSHWKRLYKRTLEPILSVYNAQLDSGDFFHVGFSIFTYTNLHLASGYSLDKLDDNLQTFADLFNDYNIPNAWRVSFPKRVVSNMLGESDNPLILFGDTPEQQEERIAELEAAGDFEALEYLNFLQLYMAVFFNDFELAETSLAKLSDDVDGIWIPWVLFFQCFVAISKLSSTKGHRRKELLSSVEELKGKLVEWYNDFDAPNPNCMVSLLEAELMMAKNIGKKEFPSIKILLAFEDAISAARGDEMQHIEAFACERAALHFEAANLDGYVAEYMRRAYTLYDEWNALAKIIEIESKYAKLLKISECRTRPAMTHNAIADNKEKTVTEISGGHGPIRPISVKKVLKRGAQNTRREIKSLFGRSRGANATEVPANFSPKLENSPESPRRLPPPSASPFGRKQRAAKPREAPNLNDSMQHLEQTHDPDPESAKNARPSVTSPQFARLPFGGKKTESKSENSEKLGVEGLGVED